MDDIEILEGLADGRPDVHAEHARATVRSALFGEALQRVRIGRFSVLERIGEGGMGVVFSAYDTELDRKIAIKLIRADAAIDSTVRARLLREAKALARLSDPHVVHVYEVGEHNDQVYVAMEFVAGISLQEWVLRDPERPWHDSVQMFCEVGKGLAAAHSSGVVHRDFKPANVLIGDDGRPRVVDFGLARFENSPFNVTENATTVDGPEDQSVTATGTLAGTPAYMAPEQFECRPTDAKTDQFSFCVALWECVYRVPPFDRRSFELLATQVTAGQLQTPTHPPVVPNWLRQALERGLAVDPSRRWPSMAALLAALRHGLGRRHRLRRVAAASGGLAALGLAAVALAAPEDERCQRAADHLEGVWDDATRAEIHDALFATGTPVAGQTWTRVQAHLDAYAQAWVDMRTEACESTLHGEQSAKMLDRRTGCLDERWISMEATVSALKAIDRQGVLRAVPLVASLPELEVCADAERLLAGSALAPPPELEEAMADIKRRLAEIEAMDALGAVLPALEASEALLADAEEIGFVPVIARARLTHGLMLEAAGRHEPAREAFAKARLEATAVGDDGLVFRALDRLVFNRGLLAGQVDAALETADLALATAQRLGREDSADVAFLHDHVGAVLRQKGDLEQALARHQQALELATRTLADDDRHVAVVHVNLGVILYEMGRHDEAIEHYEQGLAVLERGLGSLHPDVALTHDNLGLALVGLGRYEEGLAHQRKALEITETSLGPEHPDVALVDSEIGRTLSEMGRDEEALEHQLRALALWERTLGADHQDLAIGHAHASVVLRRLGRLKEALAHAHRELEIRELRQGAKHGKTATAHLHVADTKAAQEDLDGALVHYRQALEINEAVHGPSGSPVAGALTGIGMVLVDKGAFAEAAQTLERAVEAFEGAQIPPGNRAEAKFALARALWNGETDRERALLLAREARETFAVEQGHWRDELVAVEAWLEANETPATGSLHSPRR